MTGPPPANDHPPTTGNDAGNDAGTPLAAFRQLAWPSSGRAMAWFLLWCAAGAAPTLILLAAANRALGLSGHGPDLPGSGLSALAGIACLAHGLGVRAVLAGLTRHRLEVWPDHVVVRREGLAGSDTSTYPLGDRRRLGGVIEASAVQPWGGRPSLELRILQSHASRRVRVAMPDQAAAGSAAAMIMARIGSA